MRETPNLPRVSKFFICWSTWKSPSRTRFAALLATLVRGIVLLRIGYFVGYLEKCDEKYKFITAAFKLGMWII